MNQFQMKGWVHVALAIAGAMEIIGSRTKTRRFLNGLALGWHAQAAAYHFIFEKD